MIAVLKLLSAVPILGWIGLVGCLVLTVRELWNRFVTPWRLAILPGLAALVSLSTFGPSGLVGRALFLPWLAALVLGAVIGAVAAMSLSLRVDHQWNVIRLRGNWSGVLLSLVLVGWFLFVGTLLRQGGGLFWGTALVAGVALGTGFFIGRALMCLHRAHRTPHSDIVNAYSAGVS